MAIKGIDLSYKYHSDLCLLWDTFDGFYLSSMVWANMELCDYLRDFIAFAIISGALAKQNVN